MPVVKFPGVTKTIYEMTPEEIEEAFNRVVTTLPRWTEEEAAVRQEQLDEEFYYEDATETISGSLGLLFQYRAKVIEEFGDDSAEVVSATKEIAPVVMEVRKLETNLDNPDVKKIIKSLRDVWGEYEGGSYDEKGEYKWNNKPIGVEVIPAIRSAINFDL